MLLTDEEKESIETTNKDSAYDSWELLGGLAAYYFPQLSNQC